MNTVVDQAHWWIPAPGEDELLRSVLGRAAALFECSPHKLWASLNEEDNRPSKDIDSPSPAALLRLAHALGIPAMALAAHRLPEALWRLVPEARRCYCPACWNENLRAGRPRTLRRAWTHVLRTKCAMHGHPLILAPDTWATTTSRYEHPIASFSQDEQNVMDLIESFGTALEGSLYFGAPWPKDWHGTPQIARSLLGAVSFNLGTERDFPPIRNVDAHGALAAFICSTRHLQEPFRGDTWAAFRAIVNPGVRRAALWAVAWVLVPDLPSSLSPGWFKDLDGFHPMHF